MNTGDSLVELLRLRAEEVGDRVAYRWLQDGERESASLSFADLDREARKLGAALAKQGEVGDRALLVFAPGLEFITAFFGCLYAGIVAVPVYPPRQERDLTRLFGVLQDAEPKWVLTTKALRQRITRKIQLPILDLLAWIEVDTLDPDLAETWSSPTLDGDTLAFLQYTSGSTSAPKGVQVHHRHLLHNEAMIQQAFDQSEESVVVSWLPLYHDMGLIGGVLQPLYLGASCVLMSPAAFLKRPVRWLQAISRYRATTSGGPNFAYDLCTHRIPPNELEALDLSSWRVAFNGAEPIRAESLERFAQRFGEHGFSRRAFYPCYGLAEATLFVSGGQPDSGPVLRDFDANALERGQARPPSDEGTVRPLVGCGHPWMDQQVLAVDPQTRQPLEDGTIGEIWIAGPSVAGGYWRNEATSREAFGAHLANGDGPFLRTGDLGFVDDGEIFIAGRLKDLIILRGRNLYPQDIERTVETSAPGLRLGCGAAFSVDVAGEERLVVVQEVDPKTRQAGQDLLATVRAAVADVHQAALHQLVLVPPHTVPKTSSGKIQRRLCRKRYLDDKLPIEELLSGADAGTDTGAEIGVDGPSEFDALTVDQLRDQPEELRAEWLCGFLQSLGERHLGHAMSPSMSYLQQGMDSLRAVSLQHDIETALGLSLPISRLLEGLSIEQLAASLLADLGDMEAGAMESGEIEGRGADGHGTNATPILRQGETEGEHPTSFGQQALLALEHRSPKSAALHVSAAVRLVGVDPERLQRALGDLVARHPALRTSFRFETSEPRQVVTAQGTFDGAGAGFLEDASALSEADFAARLADEAHRPFDLTAGPLMRGRLFRRTDGEHVLLWVVHHLVCDLWSWSVMVRDLGRLYQNPRVATDTATQRLRYTDHVHWQRPWLESEAGKALEDFWRETLEGVPGVLDLPTDQPYPALQSFRGEKLVRRVDRERLTTLEQTADAHGTTLFTVLMAAYQALLWRYTGEPRPTVGSPMAGRRRPEVGEVVGYFVNLVPIVGDLRRRPTFGALLERTRANVLDALEHQDYPLPLMVERLTSPQRDLSRPPIFQTVFVLQSAVAGDASLGAFALGMPGVGLDLAGLRAESMALDPRGSQFELTLTAAEVPEGLALSLLYASDLFDAVRMERLLDHFETLLRGALDDPARPMSELSLLSPAEEDELRAWGAWTLATRSAGGPKPVPTLEQGFIEQARQRPDAVAVVDADGLQTYGALDRQSDRLATRLRALGVGTEDRVALALERTSRLLVGVLGVLKAGGAYVPLDPKHPEDRIRFVLQDAAPAIVLSERSTLAGLPWLNEAAAVENLEALDSAAPDPAIPAPSWTDRAAYLIYTSGSTGRPKGVVVTHGNVQRLFAASQGFRPGPDDAWTLFHATTFDFSVWELWGPLLHGGRLVIVPHGVSRSPHDFHDLLSRERVTILSQTPTAFRQLVQANAERPDAPSGALRRIVFGGEALDLTALGPWVDRHGTERPKLVNMYGITETTVHVTERPIHREDLARTAAPLGPPLDGWSVQVLDPRLQPVPVGVPGEICVGGAGLARGYHGRSALTAERFVPNPRSDVPGARLYRSGDLARFDFAGEWAHLGRLDDQVKIRGFRIELGEIETALQEPPTVRDGVVLARRGDDGEDRLVAYWTAHGDTETSSAALRRRLEARLPDYMVPSAFVRLDALPLTANGKLDRGALPAPEAFQPDVETPYLAPRNAAEEALAAVWGEVLGVEHVGIDDPYFALGGDSIRSIRVQALMRQRGYALAFEDLYRLPTIRELAACLERVDEDPPDDTLPPFSRVAESDRPLLPAQLVDAFPLTSVQSGMVYQSETHPDYEIYLTSLHLRAPFRPNLLRAALMDLASRHPILRTSFELARFSQPLQLVWSDVSAPLHIVDLRALPDTEHQPVIDTWLQAERRRVFAWNRAPLLRLTVHRRRDAGDDERFQLTLSEPFFDGWSVGTFLTELIERYLDLYRGEARGHQPAAMDSLASSYRQFVALEQGTIAAPESQAFWDGVLEDATPTRVPSWEFASASGNRASGEIRVERHAVAIDEDLSDGLLALAHRLEVPIKNVLLAAHLKTLSLLTGQRDLLTGLLENGRPETLDGERLLGLFLNAVCFRQRLHGQSLADLARNGLAAERALLPHRRMPLAVLQQARGGEALFDTVFNYTHFHIYQGIEALPEVELLNAFASEQTYYDLTAQFNRDHVSGRLRLVLDYRAARFEPVQMRAIGDTYRRVLRRFVEAPDAPENGAPLWSAAERHLLLAEWQDSGADFPPSRGLHREFEQRVAVAGPQPAILTGSESLSYDALNHRANRLARRWHSFGLRPEKGVAIHMERSPELVIALLATLKCGAFYLPLDPTAPPERLSFMLADSRVRWLITDQNIPWKSPDDGVRSLHFEVEEQAARAEEPTNLEVDAWPRQAAYLIYTSGSTGRPKGVVGSHGATQNRVRAMEAFLPYGAEVSNEVACQKTFFSFVDAVAEIFAPLLAGIPSRILDDETVRDHPRFLNALAEAEVTRLVLVPSLLRVLLDEDGLDRRLPRLHYWFTSGEALPPDLARRFHDRLPGRRLFNIYGSSEVAADVTWHEVTPDATSTPIGRPIANHAIRLLDRGLRPTRLGAEGQIAVHGIGLARGYLERPARTAEHFVPDPLSERPGERLYLTGDLGRYRADGELLVLGRRDQQLKIRGMRLEPGEIEAALLRRAEIRAAAVRPWTEGGVTRLAAYLVPTRIETDGLETEALREDLRGRLPDAFLPDAFVVLDQLPLTPSGKLDVRALPTPERTLETDGFVAPRGATEELLAGIWSEVLGIETLSARDDFHALGGHSLLATQVISRLRQAFDVELPLSRLFEAPTIERLAREVERAQRGRSRPKLERTGEGHPLSFAQQRLCFIDRMAPGDPVYNLPGAVRLEGSLDVAALGRALAGVVARHETLRAHFLTVGTGFEQHIARQFEMALPIVDLSALRAEDRSSEARRVEGQEVRRAFDLGRGPLLRAALLRLDDEAHEFLLTLHHVVSDGWSQGVLIRELIALYRAESLDEPSSLPELPVQYSDFAAWQRGWLAGDELTRQTRWWTEQLSGAPPALDLPTDRPRPEVLSSRGGVIRRRFDATFMDAVRVFARRQNTSLFMTLMAAFEVVMHHASDQEDLVIGTDVANREQIELEGLIGFFVNQLVLRFSVGGDPSFREILERTRRHALGAYAHQDLPFDKLVEAINPPRTRNRTPLFQVKFVLQNAPQPPLAIPGLTVTPLEVDTRTAKFDQLWNLWERDGELSIAVEYASDLFAAASIERLLNLFHRTLELVQAQPESSLQDLRQHLEESERAWKREREERWRQASRGRFKLTKKSPRSKTIKARTAKTVETEPELVHQDQD